MADGTAPVIFICYSTKDRPIANDVCEKLEAGGVRCWMAPRDVTPAQPWGREIVLAIRNSSIVLLIFTKSANESNDVLNEVVVASDFNRAILTYRHEDLVPGDALLYYLQSLQWFDAFAAHPERRIDELTRFLKGILAASTRDGRVTIGTVAGPAGAPLGAPSAARDAASQRESTPPTIVPAATRSGPSGIADVRDPLTAVKASLETVRKKLANYVGPIAGQVVDDAVNAAHSESDFYERCTQYLLPKERERFLLSVNAPQCRTADNSR